MVLPCRPSHSQLRIAGLLLWLCACHSRQEIPSASPAPETVCYTLTFGPWEPPDSSPFSNAPVGLLSPLPDTVALTPIPVVLRSGPPQYRLSRLPERPEQGVATWSPTAPGVLILRFPEAAGQGLLITLRGTGLQLE